MIDITIMMVTYNRLDLTKKTINSLLKTVKVPFNFVIVDNGSTDGTQDYLDELINNFNNFYIIKLLENKGIAIGRNLALKKADELETKWFCTIDNDVEMPEGWLQESINILEANKSFGIIGVNMEGVEYPIVTRNNYTFQEKPKGNLGTACMVFRKQVHQMIGFFTTEYGKYGEEDADFGMRTRIAGFKMGYIKQMGIHLGSDELDIGEYRMFKTKQHSDNLVLFKQNCAKYSQRTKSLFVPFNG